MFGLLEVRHPAVFVVPVTADDRVVLVHCDRYTTGTSWEVPAGGSDGEELRVTGERELAEETGYVAARWDHLGVSGGSTAWPVADRGVPRARPDPHLRDVRRERGDRRGRGVHVARRPRHAPRRPHQRQRKCGRAAPGRHRARLGRGAAALPLRTRDRGRGSRRAWSRVDGGAKRPGRAKPARPAIGLVARRQQSERQRATRCERARASELARGIKPSRQQPRGAATRRAAPRRRVRRARASGRAGGTASPGARRPRLRR